MFVFDKVNQTFYVPNAADFYMTRKVTLPSGKTKILQFFDKVSYEEAKKLYENQVKDQKNLFRDMFLDYFDLLDSPANIKFFEKMVKETDNYQDCIALAEACIESVEDFENITISE